MNDLHTLVELSHEFGTADYVLGGGGNTSCKDAATLWVKPSGTTLAEMTANAFVTLDRASMGAIYAATPPAAPAAREELIKNLMAAAVRGGGGRPSVEAPLHNAFAAKFVVHTHPTAVNGLTCARGGAAAARKLFPDALWVDYIDPGYTLCMDVRRRLADYHAAHGKEPALLLLKNHGIFVAADTAAEIQSHYARVMRTLADAYRRAGVALPPSQPPAAPAALEAENRIRAIFGPDAAFLSASARFVPAAGPLSPDHLVYAKAYPFRGELTVAAAAEYRQTRGYAPKVVAAGERAYGLGASQKAADLARALAWDAARVVQLAEAFGGVEYMSDAARAFIENWEVESYRQRQSVGG